MSQPFVVSLKIQGDSKDAVTAIDATERELVALKNTAVSAASGQVAARQSVVTALQREQAATDLASAATRANTAAIAANENALRRANAQRTNLLFQLQDIGVSLASGMNPLMVAAQQGSQISMIYGPEEGGLGRAFQETGKMATGLVSRLAPLGVAIAGLTTLLYGFTRQINESEKAQVSMGDVAVGVWQSMADAIQNTLGPAATVIADFFNREIDRFTAEFAREANFIIGLSIGTVDAIKAAWGVLPQAIGNVMFEASRNVSNEIVKMQIDVMSSLNGFLSNVDGLLVKFGGKASLPRFDVYEYGRQNYKNGENPYASVGAEVEAAKKAFADAMNQDYVGNWLNDVGARALANYNSRLDDTEGSAGRAASGLKIVDDAARSLNDNINFGRDTFRSLFTDMRQGLSEGMTFWEALGNAGSNALDKIADRALGMAADGIFNMLLGAVMPGFGMTGGSWGAGLWGSAIFNAKGNVYAAPALSAYSNTVVDQPTMFAFAKGAGIMGEAGAEAILPLRRSSDGSLGVIANVEPRQGLRGSVSGPGSTGNAQTHFTFAPSTVINVPAGSGVSKAEIQAMLDARDEAQNAQFSAKVADFLENPRRV